MNSSMDPETLEREADRKRANLNRTLDAVEQRFSPNQLVQQTVDYFGEHGGDIAHSVSRSVKANPIPLMLTGVGLAWLIATQSKSTAAYDDDRRYRDQMAGWDDENRLPARTRSAYTQNALSVAGTSSPANRKRLEYNPYDDEDDGSMMDGAKEAAQDLSRTISQWRNDLQAKLLSVKQEAGETAEQWRDRVVSTSVEQADGIDRQYRQITQSANDWKGDLQAKLQSVKQEAGESADQWRERVVNTSVEQAENLDMQYRQAKQRMAQAKQQMVNRGSDYASSAKDFMHEQPLVAGALGIAVGAIIGSLLPSSRIEDEFIGGRADSVKSSLAERAEAAGEQVASSVTDKAESLRAKGEQQLNEARSKGSSTELA